MAGGTDPFDIEPGTGSGRIIPTGALPAEGDFVFVLGSDLPGWTGNFVDGDEVEVSQTGEHSPAEIVRFKISVRGPVSMPAGWAWSFVLRADGVDAWTLPIDPGRPLRVLSDLGLDVVGLPATIALSFALVASGPIGEVAELELPAVYLDDLILDAAQDLEVINKDPGDVETDVPRDSSISFDVVDTTGDDPDPAATQVFVDGVLAYDGALGGARPGFAVVTTTPIAGVLHFEIDVLPILFESLATVVVRVVSNNVGTSASIDETSSFVVVDETRPIVLSAVGRELRRVRVTFDEPVLQASAAGVGDALNPASWVLEPRAPDDLTPAATLGVASVESVSNEVVDLLLDDDASPGVPYEVRAIEVLDLFGNETRAPLDRVTFAAFVPPRPEGREFDLYGFFPDLNRGEDSIQNFALLRFVRTLQEVQDLVLFDSDRWTDIFDVDTAEEIQLDHMLAGLGNPFDWAVEELSVTDKRRLIRVLVDIYKQKGTDPGVINAVRFFLGVEVSIDEYADSGWILDVDLLGESSILGTSVSALLYSFDVLSEVVLTDDQRTRIRQIGEYMKPAHTHLVRILDPVEVFPPDHLELGVSLLIPSEWILH